MVADGQQQQHKAIINLDVENKRCLFSSCFTACIIRISRLAFFDGYVFMVHRECGVFLLYSSSIWPPDFFSLFLWLCQMPVSTSYLMFFLCYPGTSSFPAFSLFFRMAELLQWEVCGLCNNVKWFCFIFFPERKKNAAQRTDCFVPDSLICFIYLVSFLFVSVHCALVSIADCSRRVLSWQICHVSFLPFFLFFFGGVFFFFLRIFSHLCCLFRTQLFFIIYTFSCWWCRMKHNGERWWTQTKTRTDIALFVLFQFIFFLVFRVDFASFVFPWHSFCVRWMECPAATRTNKAMMFQLERCSEPTLMPFLRHWLFPCIFFFFCAFFLCFFLCPPALDWLISTRCFSHRAFVISLFFPFSFHFVSHSFFFTFFSFFLVFSLFATE